MEIRNDYNVPKPLYNALAHDSYVAGTSDFSVTELLDPPQLVILKKRHLDQVSIDATENLYSLLGTAIHNYIDKHTDSEALTEERFYIALDVPDFGEVTVSGQIDFYQDGVLRDYKVTSTMAYQSGSRFDHWKWQLNFYTYLMRLHNYPVRHHEICMILRDWSLYKARYNPLYPRSPIITKTFPTISSTVVYNKLIKLVTRHLQASTMSDAELAVKMPCTPADMWQAPSTYAVIKDNAKRALKVFKDEQEALEWSARRHFCVKGKDGRYVFSDKFKVEERKGECMRCGNYCLVKDFCHQYQQMLVQKQQAEKEKMDAKKEQKQKV